MRAVVFQHEEHEGPGLLAPALQAAGFTLVPRFRAVRREDVDAELLVVMGGRMAVYESDQHPFLRQELGILMERLAYERPCLGFCLGAQMLASAAGANVFAGKNGLEVGVGPVRWTTAAQQDPVVSGAKPRTVVAHWHGDTYEPVPEATLLASTDRYTQQAFRLGTSYGFQFHLELTATEMGRWLDIEADSLQQRGKSLQELKAQLPKLKAAEADNTEVLHRLANHFARVAAGR